MSSGTGTITPRTFSTRRIIYGDDYDAQQQYEKIANLVKKYGCPISKVSDGMYKVDDSSHPAFWTAIYFDIPVAFKDKFLAEEKGQ